MPQNLLKKCIITHFLLRNIFDSIMLRITFLHFSYFFFQKSKIKCRKNSWKLVFLHFFQTVVHRSDCNKLDTMYKYFVTIYGNKILAVYGNKKNPIKTPPIIYRNSFSTPKIKLTALWSHSFTFQTPIF